MPSESPGVPLKGTHQEAGLSDAAVQAYWAGLRRNFMMQQAAQSMQLNTPPNGTPPRSNTTTPPTSPYVMNPALLRMNSTWNGLLLQQQLLQQQQARAAVAAARGVHAQQQQQQFARLMHAITIQQQQQAQLASQQRNGSRRRTAPSPPANPTPPESDEDSEKGGVKRRLRMPGDELDDSLDTTTLPILDGMESCGVEGPKMMSILQRSIASITGSMRAQNKLFREQLDQKKRGGKSLGLNPSAPAFTPTKKPVKKEEEEEPSEGKDSEEVEEDESTDDTPQDEGSEKGARPAAPPPTCHFFLRGTCKQGDKCRYSHGHPQTPSKRALNSVSIYDQPSQGTATPPSSASTSTAFVSPGMSPGMSTPTHNHNILNGINGMNGLNMGVAGVGMMPGYGMMGTVPLHSNPFLPNTLRTGLGRSPDSASFMQQQQRWAGQMGINGVMPHSNFMDPPSAPSPTEEPEEKSSEEIETPKLSSFFVAPNETVARAYHSLSPPCEVYAEGAGCSQENIWPHKLCHYFSEEKGVHETDIAVIYPEPRCKYRTCQVHPKKMSRWEPTTQGWVQATPVFAHDSSTHTEHDGKEAAPRIKRFSIMTYNVLFDHYLREMIQSNKRYHALFEVIREADCDIVCLQEVQPAFLKEILKEEWLRAQYWSSAEPECCSLTFSGVVILTKHAFSSIAVHDMPQTCGNTSPCVRGTLPVDGKNEVTICSAHLNHSDVHVKTCQLANMLRLTEASPHNILIGDFNVHSLNLGEDYADAWVESCASRKRRLRTPKVSPGGTPPNGQAEDSGEEYLASGHTISTANPMAAMMSENDKRETSVLSTLLHEHLSQRRKRRSSNPPKDVEEVEVSGRIDCILYRNRNAKRRAASGKQKINLSVVRQSGVVGGKEKCRAYLIRRFIRLCKAIGCDPTTTAADNNISIDVKEESGAGSGGGSASGGGDGEDSDGTKDTDEHTEEAPAEMSPDAPYTAPPYTTPDLLGERLKDTIDSLTKIHDFLCPSGMPPFS